MDSIEAIKNLEACIDDPHRGLPEEVFLFIGRITPLINVDLLIKDERNRTLLSWRDDGYSPPAWHVPGGIIRFKETAADRIRAVAKSELGADVEFKPVPLAIREIIHPMRKIGGTLSPCCIDVPLRRLPMRTSGTTGGHRKKISGLGTPAARTTSSMSTRCTGNSLMPRGHRE